MMGGNAVPLQTMQLSGTCATTIQGDTTAKDSEMVVEEEPPDKPPWEIEDEDEVLYCSGPPSSDSEDEDALKEEDDLSNLEPTEVTLQAFPIESIECSTIPLIGITSEPWEDLDIKADRLLLSKLKEWREDYQWDYTARKVAVRWFEFRMQGQHHVALLRKLWKSFTQEEVLGPILREVHEKDLEGLFKWAHMEEWDIDIVKKLPFPRTKILMRRNISEDYRRCNQEELRKR
jgi:hypothetical protein